MTQWTVWRQDDNGNRYPVGGYDDRIDALARVLALASGVVHKQTYWVDGPPDPACVTNRDLYVRLNDAGERMTTAGRTLDEFLRAWWLVSRPLAGRSELDLDTVAAMIVAAETVPPPPLGESWRTAEFRVVGEVIGYPAWEAIVLSQVADLADFADQGPFDQYASLGVDAPRPPGRVRATGLRWYNVDPRGYLECGMAGALGGWDEADELRVPVPGPVVPLRPEPAPGERPVPTLTWADLAELAVCGQEYE
ncbi:hypothetical protein V6U90_10680 [Micromonospora sp. CPCC 206060]|uniref:hypothetical protein n=1 Tax=Micromonospora sp. CPCC 206060 TaxID=3122406 RepID=UPI002FF1DE87